MTDHAAAITDIRRAKMTRAADHRHTKEARARGHRDYSNGVPYADCPYLATSPLGQEWKNGWLALHVLLRARTKVGGRK